MKTFEADTCVDAWLSASEFLLEQPEWRAYTIVLEIADPLALPPRDRAVHDVVDGFLRRKRGLPISTVVNTIFPAQLYERHGPDGVYEQYPALQLRTPVPRNLARSVASSSVGTLMLSDRETCFNSSIQFAGASASRIVPHDLQAAFREDKER